MADTTAPAPTEPASPKSMAVPLTAFAAGGVVAVLIGVFAKVHDPTLDGTTTLGFNDVRDMKVVVSTVIGVLAVGQVIGALWIYGKLGIKPPSWLGMAHRISGTVALLLAVFVGYHCIWAFGFQTGTVHGYEVPARAIVHEVLACAVFGAVVVKVVAVRSKRAPGWFLPVAGGLLFSLLIVIVLTSAGWYLNEKGWPT
jgi:hypothetical protein